MKKICIVCDKEFEPIKANELIARCCSQSCNQINWRKNNREKNNQIKINWRRKNGIPEKGSQEHRRKMAILSIGNKNRNKGGYENHLKHGRKRVKLIQLADGWHSRLEWDCLKEKYNYTCVCCLKKEPEIKLTKDHVVPLTKNGTNYIDNIQPLCKYCNSKKNNKTIDFRLLWQSSEQVISQAY